MARLSEQDLDDLKGYADGEARVRARRNLTAMQLKEVALNDNVEKCPGCYWWVDSHELIPTDGRDLPDGKCSNCRMVNS